ncbi:HNH endonuclease [Devosia limi]|uniref:HNH endonuclease n=1 Tax=Devosia limi TaxID=288995 RepID=UPI0009345B5D
MAKNKIIKLRDAAFILQNGQCFYCGCQMVKASAPRGSMQSACTAEHMIPKSEGGASSSVNIKAACRYCNHTRHKMKPVLSPEAYRNHVRRRLAEGKWRPHSARMLS